MTGKTTVYVSLLLLRRRLPGELPLIQNKYLNLLGCIILAMSATSVAQEPNCSEIKAAAGMVRARSSADLLSAKRKAGTDYRAQLVFAYRAFELRPGSLADAERLLKLIPQKEAEQEIVLTLGEALCEDESISEMTFLSHVRDGLAHQLAKAVGVVPEFMAQYIQYSAIATLDAHSDYAIQMRTVCKRDHRRFVSAIGSLSVEDRNQIRNHVIDPETCRAIALPEAEE